MQLGNYKKNYKKITFCILITIILLLLLYVNFWFHISINDENEINDYYSKSTLGLKRTLGFGHIYVINLASRKDRRKKMEAIAKYLDLNFDFVTAVPKEDFRTMNRYTT